MPEPLSNASPEWFGGAQLSPERERRRGRVSDDLVAPVQHLDRIEQPERVGACLPSPPATRRCGSPAGHRDSCPSAITSSSTWSPRMAYQTTMHPRQRASAELWALVSEIARTLPTDSGGC